MADTVRYTGSNSHYAALSTRRLSPHPEITTPPSPEDLQRRQALYEGTIYYAPNNVCGYISSESDRPWSCDTSDTCVFGTSSGGYVACCHDNSCSLAQRGCVDSADVAASKCDQSCLSDLETRKCTFTDLPFCGTLLFPDAFNVVDYQCVSTNSSIALPAYLTYAGQDSNATLSEHFTIFNIITTTSSTGAASSQPIATVYLAPQTSATPVGAIVGGTVGGAAALILLCVGAWLLRRRRRRGNMKSMANPGAETEYAGKAELADTPVPLLPPVELDEQRPVQEATVSEPADLRALHEMP